MSSYYIPLNNYYEIELWPFIMVYNWYLFQYTGTDQNVKEEIICSNWTLKLQ